MVEEENNFRTTQNLGFKKTASKRWEFQHEKFRKGCKHLLMEIARKKCEPSAFPQYLKPSSGDTSSNLQTPSSSSMEEENMLLLLDENKNLKRDNMELQMQIQHYKSLEIKLSECVSQYMGSDHQYQRNDD
nr:heat stress transcription factor B-2a-like [Tanacetum cinerariifolium]